MALIKCKECGKEISDKADRCPNCGCPVSYSVNIAEETVNDDKFAEWNPGISSEESEFVIEINGNRENMTKLWMECDGKIDCIAKLRKKHNLSLKASKDYVDEFMRKTNTSDMIKTKKKNSVLSFIAFTISLLGCGCISIVGTILAIIDLKTNDKSKKHDLSVAAIIIMAVWWFLVILFFAYSDDSSNQTTTDDTTTEQAITQEDITTGNKVADVNEDVATELTTEIELTFDDKVKELLGEEPGNNILKILKDDIGFTELFDIEKVNDTLNYKVNANGYEIMITEISDTDFRVIIPNSDYVFYENNSVSMTYDEFKDRQIDSTDMTIYYSMAKEIIENSLKNPSSADFPSIVFNPQDISMQKKGDLIAVQSYVDAENSFGGTIRSKWTVQFKVIDKESYSYEPTYISIDGNGTGQFIDMD